jgi:hypothetical protein
MSRASTVLFAKVLVLGAAGHKVLDVTGFAKP